MHRRSFLKAGGAITLAAGARPLQAKIPPHNFDKYDFGGGRPWDSGRKMRLAACRAGRSDAGSAIVNET